MTERLKEENEDERILAEKETKAAMQRKISEQEAEEKYRLQKMRYSEKMKKRERDLEILKEEEAKKYSFKPNEFMHRKQKSVESRKSVESNSNRNEAPLARTQPILSQNRKKENYRSIESQSPEVRKSDGAISNSSTQLKRIEDRLLEKGRQMNQRKAEAREQPQHTFMPNFVARKTELERKLQLE